MGKNITNNSIKNIMTTGIFTTKIINGTKETVYLMNSMEWKQEGEFEFTDIMKFKDYKDAFEFIESQNWQVPEPFKLTELIEFN